MIYILIYGLCRINSRILGVPICQDPLTKGDADDERLQAWPLSKSYAQADNLGKMVYIFSTKWKRVFSLRLGCSYLHVQMRKHVLRLPFVKQTREGVYHLHTIDTI